MTLMKQSRLIISDSGGIAEESSFLDKKMIVCREKTERPESLGTHSFLCPTPDKLEGMSDKLINNFEVNLPCPYGDGAAYKKIRNIFEKL